MMATLGYLIVALLGLLGLATIGTGLATLIASRAAWLRICAKALIALGLLLVYPMGLVIADRLGWDIARWPLGSPETSTWIVGD